MSQPRETPQADPNNQLAPARVYPHLRADINPYDAPHHSKGSKSDASKEPLSPEPAEHPSYAWSADEAYFASVAVRARYAKRADRIVPCPPGLEIQGSLEECLVQAPVHEALLKSFENAHRRQPSKNVKVAELASYATNTVFAEHAREAYQAREITAPPQNVPMGANN